eukprot:SAG31_NODE_8653_length_1413_cov_1.282344_2_plen_63_part_00
MGDQGTVKICDAIKKNHRTKLHKLGMSSNQITDFGVKTLHHIMHRLIDHIMYIHASDIDMII